MKRLLCECAKCCPPGGPFGPEVAQARAKSASLAACKARALRRLQADHWDDFVCLMNMEGWHYEPEGDYDWDAAHPGRPRQWLRMQP